MMRRRGSAHSTTAVLRNVRDFRVTAGHQAQGARQILLLSNLHPNKTPAVIPSPSGPGHTIPLRSPRAINSPSPWGLTGRRATGAFELGDFLRERRHPKSGRCETEGRMYALQELKYYSPGSGR